jgi:hypothetical protein
LTEEQKGRGSKTQAPTKQVTARKQSISPVKSPGITGQDTHEPTQLSSQKTFPQDKFCLSNSKKHSQPLQDKSELYPGISPSKMLSECANTGAQASPSNSIRGLKSSLIEINLMLGFQKVKNFVERMEDRSQQSALQLLIKANIEAEYRDQLTEHDHQTKNLVQESLEKMESLKSMISVTGGGGKSGTKQGSPSHRSQLS